MTETYEDYAKRMVRNSRQFSYFGIEPIWHPGENDIEGFCHDEVVRQFHDTREWDDGGRRIEYMLDAWRYAQTEALRTPTVDDIKELGAHVEPDYNYKGFRLENVYIGDRLGVFPPYLNQAVEILVGRAGDVVPGTARGSLVYRWQIEDFKNQAEDITTVDQWYLAYEWIHPFRDGNGRTGKILHNWLNGTLDDPVLVPDYFGSGNP